MLEKIKAFLKLVRWFHEVAVIIPFLGLYLIIDYYSRQNNVGCALSGFNFFLLCFCVQTLIAAGCVLNDILDRNIDKINKPKTHIVDNTISLRNTKIIFAILTLIIIALSVYISIYMFSEWAYISLSVYVLSLLYDFYFKRSPLMGNILMALLTSFIPLVLFFFAKDCIEILNNEKITVLIYLYAALPFLIIIPRELSLDISDIEGDKADGCRTLPIVIGVKKSKLVVVAFLVLIIVLSIPTSIKYQYLAICLTVIDVLLLIYLYKLRTAETRIEYIKIGRFLWFIMILGLVAFTVSTIIL
ncbi:MAG: geranylgeranylglycerol-phosphate geranylgeranyltransferase [Bacteroidota bacterium]